MPFFTNIFKSKDAAARKNTKLNGAILEVPSKPRWVDAWIRKDVEPEEVQELIRGCTYELKSRALDMPFLLLPFRPASDPSAARSFIRNYFNANPERGAPLKGEHLAQELRLTEPLVLCSVIKWCWSRLAGGIVTWEAYELFKIGEQDSSNARDAFATFIPISVGSDARTKIVFDFFDLMAAIAAHGKVNGMGGRKLSRLAGWWAFEHVDTGNGFDGGYKAWASAADATSHLFFAYLRSLTPDSVQGINGFSTLPRSLQSLLEATEYPPAQHTLLQSSTTKVVMIVDAVSPTPFALLRRAKHFEYREDDQALQQFSEYEDPVQALTDECRRVLKNISSANDSATTKASTSLGDASWSRFEDLGFAALGEESDHDDEIDGSALGRKRPKPSGPPGLRTTAQSKPELGRPTTPSWADFLSSGFVDENGQQTTPPLLLPPDKILPPIITRGQSSQSHRRMINHHAALEPGELASINQFDLDDAFWWVWITSLAGEEPVDRKAAFGRCALIETNIRGGKWLVMEEIIQGAAPEPEAGAYIAEKKSRFGFSKRARLTRSRSSGKRALQPNVDTFQRNIQPLPAGKTNIAPDQHARIQAAAAALQQKNRGPATETNARRARQDDAVATKTNSVFTLQPVFMTEAAPALQWANSYDRSAIRAKYLGENFVGRGATSTNDLPATNGNGDHMLNGTNGFITAPMTAAKSETHLPRNSSYGFPDVKSPPDRNHDLPALPAQSSTPVRAPSPLVTVTPRNPSPAPLPAAPPEDLTATNQAAAEAAHVPIPSSTPMDTPRAATRKPLPPIHAADPSTVDPDAFSPGPEYSAHPAVVTTISTDSSPESKKAEARKLKKKGGQTGIKGLFGRKKTENLPEPAPASTTSGTAVAAARAALEKSHKTTLHPTIGQDKIPMARRLSQLGRRKSPGFTAIVPVAAPASVPDVAEVHPSPPTETAPVPAMHHPVPDVHHSPTNLSRVATNDQPQSDRTFPSFDQGPLQDQPAFVPDDSPTRSPERAVTPEIREGPYIHKPLAAEPPAADTVVEPVTEVESPVSPIDRWAQIRKNAAERAARQAQDQPPDREYDDDEESAGETIESRVARIKARVAELTGNMEAPRHV